MKDNTYNLFVYGSLRDPSIFHSVCGLSYSLKPERTGQGVLRAELALLPGYRKVSPDNVYAYAVKSSNAKIEGFVIYEIPDAAMNEIDKYEGKLYQRETVTVNTANGPVWAQSYLASHKSMKKKFGDRWHVNYIHELWLRKRIENFFEKHTRPGEKSLDADVERRARRELLGTTERDLVVSHLGSDAVSDFYLEHELDRPCPSITRLYKDPKVAPFMTNYLALVVKQMLLNQFEYILQTKYRFELEQIFSSRRYYTRTISLLIALGMLNSNRTSVDLIVQRCLDTMPPNDKYDLIDYIKYGISAADSVFDSRVAKSMMDRIRTNRQPGLIPLGAELELSNLGFRAVQEHSEQHTDNVFDEFKYFQDFCLDILTWRLGGYIDDHSGTVTYRQRGFLELAPGRLNIAGEISKPATSDPWVMNQIIHEMTTFYPIEPHSLHLSFQLRKNQIGQQKVLPLSFVKCLLALGGGTQTTTRGTLWVSRMDHQEIERDEYGEELVFARTSKRKSSLIPDAVGEKNPAHSIKYVQQYKFIRLDSRANYEPLIMALKGLQIGYNPGDFLTIKQLKSSRKLRIQYQQLKEWAANPDEISRQTRTRFLDTIKKGLMNEAGRKPYHRLHYIDWALGAIDVQLRLFNKQMHQRTDNPLPAVRWIDKQIEPVEP